MGVRFLGSRSRRGLVCIPNGWKGARRETVGKAAKYKNYDFRVFIEFGPGPNYEPGYGQIGPKQPPQDYYGAARFYTTGWFYTAGRFYNDGAV